MKQEEELVCRERKEQKVEGKKRVLEELIGKEKKKTVKGRGKNGDRFIEEENENNRT